MVRPSASSSTGRRAPSGAAAPAGGQRFERSGYSNNTAQRRNITPSAGMRPVERPGGRRVIPREQPRMHYGDPGCFYNHHHPHYYGYRVHHLPTHYRRVHYWDRTYYYYDGIYYRYYGHNYYVCRPPYGIFFDRALYDLELAACDFAYYNNVYRTYNIIDSNYSTIQSQNQIIAQNNAIIAQQNADMAAASGNALAAQKAAAASAYRSEASYNLATRLGLVQSYADAGVQYYYDDGVFFIQNSNGQYETIVPPAGALVEKLPDDYDLITIDGVELYKLDDTVYHLVMNAGKAFFEVLGQMPSSMAAQYEQNN